MKKYVSCFLFFFLLTSASLITLFLMTVGEEAQRAEEVQMQESVEEPVFVSFANTGSSTDAGICGGTGICEGDKRGDPCGLEYGAG